MFCPRCGAQVAQGVRFCTNCGNPVNTAPAAPVYQPAPQPVPQPAPQPVYQPVYQQPVAPQPVREHPFADRVRDVVRKMGASPLFLVVAICFSLAQLISLLSVGSMGNSLYNTLFPIMRELGMSSRDIREILSVISDAGGVMGFFSLIPGFLIMSGLWMVYGSSLSRVKKTGTAGLTMIQVVSIIQLVGLGILMAVILLPLLVALLEVLSYGNAESTTIMVLLFLLVAGITALIFVYYIKLCNTISCVKKTLVTGVPDHRVSGFVAVMCYIIAGYTVISSLYGVASAAAMGYVNVSVLTSLLAALLPAAAQILMGTMIFMYRKQMLQLEQGVMPPVAPAYQSAPQPAYRNAYQQPAAPQPVYQPAAPVVEVPVAEPVVAEPVMEVPVVEESVVAEPVVEVPVEEAAPTVEI